MEKPREINKPKLSYAERIRGFEDYKVELKGKNDRIYALSCYDLDPNFDPRDLIVFSLGIFDDDWRMVDAATLSETFADCGKFKVQAIEDLIFDEFPYLNLGRYNDSLDQLLRAGLIGYDQMDKLALTSDGQALSASLYEKVKADTATNL